MDFNLDDFDFYLVCGKTDMRCGINSLTTRVQHSLKLNLFSKSMFLFCGSSYKSIKVLLWDDNGFILLQKRLNTGSFKWPKNEEEVKLLKLNDIKLLLSGADLWRRIPVLNGEFLV
jgi:transposase